MFRMLLVALAGLALAAGQEVKASRPASAGCKWAPFASEKLGISLLVQECEGAAARRFMELGSTLRIVGAGQDPARGFVAVEVFEKAERQKLKDTVLRRFLERLPPRQRAGCEFVPADEKAPLGDPGKESWQIAPDAVYRGEASKMRSEDAGAEVCGPYGETDVTSYFEYHPGESKSRYLFVRLGQDKSLLDEKSIRITAR